MAPFNKMSKDNWEIWIHKFGFINVITKDNALGDKHSLGWIIWYEPDALRNGTVVHVDLLGKVTYVGYGEIMEIIRLKEAGDKEGLVKAYKEMKPL